MSATIKEAIQGRLCHEVVFMFTDNSAVESAFAKGNTPVKALFELIEKIKRAMIKFSFQLCIIYIARSRIIEQGTDGVSRGDLPHHSLGKSLRLFVPLHLSAIERSSKLKSWLSL